MPENFTDGKVTIFSSGLLVTSQGESVGAVLTADGNNEMYVGRGGKAAETTVSSGAVMYVDAGGLIAGVDVETGGVYSGGGVCSNSSRWYGGGICATQGTVILNNAEFTSNAAVELNGWAGAGGAVEIWDGTLNISGGAFTANTATGGGGAILAISGSAAVSGAAFNGNSAAYGGAIQNMTGIMNVSSCSFSGNSGPLGGAVENHQGGVMTVLDTEFTGNSATQGGAVYNDTFSSAISEMTVSGGVFSSNSAAQGGAVFNDASMTLGNADFSKNSAVSGGAVLNTSNGIMSISGGTFTSNTAIADSNGYGACGGAIANMIDYGSTDTVQLSVSSASFISNTAVYGGAVYLQTQAADQTKITGASFSANTAAGGGGAICNCFGQLSVSDGIFSDNTTAGDGGAIANWYKTDIVNTVFQNNSASFGGAVSNSYGQTVSVSGCTFNGNTATGNGGALSNETTSVSMTVTNCSFSGNNGGNGGAVFNGASMTLSDSVFATVSDTVANAGTLTISGHNSFAANVLNTGSITFDLTKNTDSSLAVADDLSKFSGGTYTIALAANQVSGSYLIADQWSTFSGKLSLNVEGNDTGLDFTIENGNVTAGTVKYGDYLYTVGNKENTNALTISVVNYIPTKLAGGADGVGWTGVEGAAGYRLELSGKENTVLECSGTALDFYGLGAGTYEWQIAVLSGGTAVNGPEITSELTAESKVLTAVENGVSDVFFARAGGVWKAGYTAVHSQTGDRAATAGKNRFRDVFAGADDANVLFLTDAANGDALFLDDVYSKHGARARITAVDEIRAGAGDDVIDLTSRFFTGTFEDLTIRGGAGDDTLWAFAKSTGNRIFGDSGNDFITGSYGDDIIAGGAGDDHLEGLGGNDIFTFGGNWGADTLGQTADGTAVLWFAEGTVLENWSASDTVLTDGTNSVTLTGGLTAGDVEIRIGAAAEPEKYEQLANLGAFLEDSSMIAVKI